MEKDEIKSEQAVDHHGLVGRLLAMLEQGVIRNA
jgi:hypothetical protein